MCHAAPQGATPTLYSLVFGEGVVNDATSIVLLRAVQRISRAAQLSGGTLLAIALNFGRLFSLSLLLGVATGLLAAYLIRAFFLGAHSTDREVSLLGLLGFFSYVAAEAAGLSGILAAFFCALTQSHFAWHSLSPSAKAVSVYAFRQLSFVAESFLLLLAGWCMCSSSLWASDYTKVMGEKRSGAGQRRGGALPRAWPGESRKGRGSCGWG